MATESVIVPEEVQTASGVFNTLQTVTVFDIDYGNLKDSIDFVHPINLEKNEQYLELLSAYVANKRPFPCLEQLKVSNAPSDFSPLVDWVYSLHTLTVLDLSKCPMSAEMQENLHLWSLTELTTLKLDSVMLSSVPLSIGRLVKLTHLSLSNNQLSSLPHTLDFCHQLETLNISHNKFQTIPGVVLNMKNLKCLRRANNQGFLQRISDRKFQEFPHLRIKEVDESVDKDSPDLLQSLAAKEIMSLHVNYWLVDSLPSLACKLLDTYGNQYNYCYQCHDNITNSKQVYVIDVLLLKFNDIRDVPFTMKSCSECHGIIQDKLRELQTELKEWIHEDLDKRMKEAMISEGVTYPDTNVTGLSANRDRKKCSVM